jgi:N-acetyltransferase
LPAAIDSFPGEYLFNSKQITRAGLEDHFCGKLMGERSHPVQEPHMTWLGPVELRGPQVSLVPLNHGHANDLVEALYDGELWKLWYTSIPSPDKLVDFIDRRLAAQAKGTLLPFAVLDNATGKAVGTTNYLNVDLDHRRLEIGGTWYRKNVQRSHVNTQCKFLLRSHQIADNGTLRDTCVYSIIASEWPTVKAHLTWQMENQDS